MTEDELKEWVCGPCLKRTNEIVSKALEQQAEIKRLKDDVNYLQRRSESKSQRILDLKEYYNQQLQEAREAIDNLTEEKGVLILERGRCHTCEHHRHTPGDYINPPEDDCEVADLLPDDCDIWPGMQSGVACKHWLGCAIVACLKHGQYFAEDGDCPHCREEEYLKNHPDPQGNEQAKNRYFTAPDKIKPEDLYDELGNDANSLDVDDLK